jgi:hypothetical protein
MKKDAEFMIAMVNQQKKSSNKRAESAVALINRIIDYVRAKDKPCSINELQKEFKGSDLRSEEFKKRLCRSEKLHFDEHTEMLSIKSKYGISNIEELKAKIRQAEFGIPEDDELKDVYPGVKNDIEKLKKENFIKVIENEDKSNVLFYRDTSDKFEEKIVDPLYKPAVEFLRKIWREEIKYHDISDKKQDFIRRKRISDDLKIKPQKRRRINKLANEHFFIAEILNASKKK